MSFKDLEETIRQALAVEAWEAERAALEAEQKRIAKRLKKLKASRPPVPERPPRQFIVVVLNVRPLQADGKLGQLEQATYEIETISEVHAEIEARRTAKDANLVWRGVVEIRRIEK